LGGSESLINPNHSKFRFGGFWSEFLTLWVGGLEKQLTQEHSKMDVPENFKLEKLTEAFQDTFKRLKKPNLVIHMFTLDKSISIYILIILSKLCEIGCLIFVYLLITSYNVESDPDMVLNNAKIRRNIIGAVVMEFARFHFKQYATYKAQKLGIVLTSSISHLLKTELFKKNIETNYFLDDDSFQTLMDKQVQSFDKYPMYHLFIIEFTMHFLITTVCGFYIFMMNFFGGFVLLLLGFITVTTIFGSLSKQKSATYLRLKAKRIAYVLNTIRNKLYIKARNWELLFYNKIIRCRDQELEAHSSLESTMIVVSWLIWTISFVSLITILVMWVHSSMAANFYYFIIYARLYLDYYFLFRDILMHRRQNEERENCITAMDSFLATREVTSVVAKDDPQVKVYFSVMTQAAYFSWNDVNSIRLQKVADGAVFSKYVRENPTDTIFENEEEDEMDDSEEDHVDEEAAEDKPTNKKSFRNSFLENSMAYTLKSETPARKTRYEPNQHAGHDLSNISIKIKKSANCFIFGEAGSGKTSLFKAMLGEMLLDTRFNSKVRQDNLDLRQRQGTLHAIGAMVARRHSQGKYPDGQQHQR
jgi:ABC-type multidrug transport system fused ATPase/permease subunit